MAIKKRDAANLTEEEKEKLGWCEEYIDERIQSEYSPDSATPEVIIKFDDLATRASEGVQVTIRLQGALRKKYEEAGWQVEIKEDIITLS